MAKIAAALNGEPDRAPFGAVAFPALDAYATFVDRAHAAAQVVATMAAAYSTPAVAALTRPEASAAARSWAAMTSRMERQLAEIGPALELRGRAVLHRNMSAAARAHGLSLGRLTMRQLTDVLTWEGDAQSLAERTGLPVNVCAVLLAMARTARTTSPACPPRPLLAGALGEETAPAHTAARPVHLGISAPPWRRALVRSVQTAAPPLLGAGAGRSV
ncbi:hypothetical protein [Streptomyces sp. TBY4]|uniref:hypothetical protein n=1 Tax=Streptomyces sp. TBY4 TaxID=2962030 RepID=UPI0020B73F59|nr:hypothetical protein [Streptomyces sp. TBY4]MCP3756022.1 hypothetical protein [Streptomyces sp. TBY4]